MADKLVCFICACVILVAAKSVSGPDRASFDLAVSQAKQTSGPKLEKSNKVARWFTRLVKSEEHFEIPDLALEEQTDPERVTHIDADLRGCTGPIKDQKQCGACYAFSWLAYAEWHYCAQTGELTDFSEQHLVDCGRKARLRGCEAGFLPDTIDFSGLFGFELERAYPYKGTEQTCTRTKGTIKAKIDAKRLVFERADWEKVLEEQPILVQVKLPADIGSYSRGIHPGTNCDPRQAHGMLLVGHGRQDGQAYWILRNSMGRAWGENGYLRLSRDAPADCMITGFVARFKFANVERELYDQFYGSLSHTPKLQAIHDDGKVRGQLLGGR